MLQSDDTRQQPIAFKVALIMPTASRMPMQPFNNFAALPVPVVAISACLAGDNVRYDGDHKAQPLLLQTLTHCVRWLRLCPEVAAGMGIPRPPVQLRQAGRGIAVVEVERTERDHTATLQRGVIDVMQQLNVQLPAAIVLKARSPSCGTGTTPLFNDKGEPFAVTDGLFARACRERFADIPLLDEAALATQTACQAFALLLLIRADIAHANQAGIPQTEVAQRHALNAHYRGFGIDTTAPQQLSQKLAQQLAGWSSQQIAHAFNAIWPAEARQR